VNATAIDRVLAAGADGAWRCVQTHLSCVAIRGDRVYKLKKPVSLGFVDFARPEARRDACIEEVRLNRRLAPEIYLGVAPLLEREGGVDFGPIRERAEAAVGERPIDWATAMRRLPEDGLLDGVLARLEAAGDRGDSLGPALDRFARRLARFHAEGPTSPEIARWGEPVAVLRRLKNSLAGLYAHGLGVLDATVPAEEPTPWLSLARLVGRRVQAAMPILAERHARGLVREVHGDLHARNLCLLDGEITAFDCIEFSFELRCRDVAADATRVGFDLAARGFDALGRRFLSAWAEAAGDRDVREVFPVFAARDGVVHAFVESVTTGEPEISEADRRHAAEASRNYALVAVGYALPRPALVMLCGLPGTGKSVLAAAAARPLRATVLRSDVIRKELAGLPPTARGDAAIYTPDWNARTYAELLRRAESALAAGEHVFVDANHGRRADRERLRDLARRLGAIPLLVEATCPEAEVRRRLAARSGDRGEVSDAGLAAYERQRAAFEPVDAAEEAPLVLTPSCDGPARIAWRLADLANARPAASP
jgi:aminoglycoside phosphotransferase family enzyme/predicted kinase